MELKDASIRTTFTEDHHRCDELWADVERAADSGNRDVATRTWQLFHDAMERHFKMEEEVLFPAFESATGMHQGPTTVMRSEHVQMRQLMERMDAAAKAGDLEGLANHGDTLLMIIQQHNVKEEGMLYPMADRALGSQLPSLAQRLQSF